jgi:DNA-cytosine methyltransferase
MKVLSLFDGISIGRLALERVGIPIHEYYASEVNKNSISISKKNWNDIEHIGSVLNVRIPKNKHLDLIIGGSPCQGFSLNGKMLNFEDPRSKLFFEYVRLLKEARRYNPNIIFLLENVKMKKEYQDIITQHLGVEPVLINSSLVSGQNRERLYWTNIKNITQPIDKKIYTEDIVLQNNNLSIIGKYISITNNRPRVDILENNYFYDPKKNINKPILVSEITNDTPSGISRQTDRICSIKGKHPCLTKSGSSEQKTDRNSDKKEDWRFTHPIEMERLQTIPDNYTDTGSLSFQQRAGILGDSWTTDVVSHILSHIR